MNKEMTMLSRLQDVANTGCKKVCKMSILFVVLLASLTSALAVYAQDGNRVSQFYKKQQQLEKVLKNATLQRVVFTDEQLKVKPITLKNVIWDFKSEHDYESYEVVYWDVSAERVYKALDTVSPYKKPSFVIDQAATQAVGLDVGSVVTKPLFCGDEPANIERRFLGVLKNEVPQTSESSQAYEPRVISYLLQDYYVNSNNKFNDPFVVYLYETQNNHDEAFSLCDFYEGEPESRVSVTYYESGALRSHFEYVVHPDTWENIYVYKYYDEHEKLHSLAVGLHGAEDQTQNFSAYYAFYPNGRLKSVLSEAINYLPEWESDAPKNRNAGSGTLYYEKKWYPSGKSESQGACFTSIDRGCDIDSVKKGLWKRWHENGRLSFQGVIDGNWNDGKPYYPGAWHTWYPSGAKKESSTLHPDNRISVYHKTSHQNQYRNETSWYEGGQKKEEGAFIKGIALVLADGKLHYGRTGQWTSWHPNGQLMLQGRYRADVRTGRWLGYYENGSQFMETFYGESGNRFGTWRYWYPGGQLAYEVVSRNDGNFDDEQDDLKQHAPLSVTHWNEQGILQVVPKVDLVDIEKTRPAPAPAPTRKYMYRLMAGDKEYIPDDNLFFKIVLPQDDMSHVLPLIGNKDVELIFGVKDNLPSELKIDAFSVEVGNYPTGFESIPAPIPGLGKSHKQHLALDGKLYTVNHFLLGVTAQGDFVYQDIYDDFHPVSAEESMQLDDQWNEWRYYVDAGIRRDFYLLSDPYVVTRHDGGAEDHTADDAIPAAWSFPALQDGVLTLWYPPEEGQSAQQRLQAQYQDKQLHGLWLYWHANGQLAQAGTFVNGQRQGVWTRWDEKGQLRWQSNYDHGVPDVSAWKVLNAKGEFLPIKQADLIDAQKSSEYFKTQGLSKRYFAQTLFQDGKVYQVWRCLLGVTAQGEMVFRDVYGEGYETLVSQVPPFLQAWDDMSSYLMVAENRVDDVPFLSSPYITRYSVWGNEKIWFLPRAEKGDLTFWYFPDQGQAARPWIEAQYEDNALHGAWRSWYASGQLEEEGAYAEGLRNGVWTKWHDTGSQFWQGLYKDGMPELVFWKIWDEQGQLSHAPDESVQGITQQQWLDLLIDQQQTLVFMEEKLELLERVKEMVQYPPDISMMSRQYPDTIQVEAGARVYGVTAEGGFVVQEFYKENGVKKSEPYIVRLSTPGVTDSELKATGILVRYHPNGVVAFKGFSDDRGCMRGNWQYWDDQGTLQKEDRYDAKDCIGILGEYY